MDPPAIEGNAPRFSYAATADNEAAEKLTKNHSYHRRTRHINHKYYYIRQEVQAENLKIVGISGKNQLADPLTKLIPMVMINAWKAEVGIGQRNLGTQI